MWRQAAHDNAEGGINKEEKDQIDSQIDSGILSGSNLFSSEQSINSENEDGNDDSKVAPEPAKAVISELDHSSGLVEHLKKIALVEENLEPLDSGTIDPDTEELNSDEIKSDKKEELWELYYAQDDDGDTQLHISIDQGYVEAAFFLISLAPHPCMLNIPNDDAQTYLHLAVLTHQPRIVRQLILAGADPTVQNFKGNTPLHLACVSGDMHCAEALTNPITSAERTSMKPGQKSSLVPEDLEIRNFIGQTSLHLAVANGHLDLVRHLLRLGADLDSREGLSGRTALHIAIELRHREIIRYILTTCRPDFDARTYAGFTPYHLACYTDQELAKELVRLGATDSMPPEFDDEDDSDENEDEEGSEEYLMALATLGMNSKPMVTLAAA